MFRILIIILVCLSSFGFVFLNTSTAVSTTLAENCPGHFQLSTFSGRGFGVENKVHPKNRSDKLENC